MKKISIVYNYMCDQSLPKVGSIEHLANACSFQISKILGMYWDSYGGLVVQVEGEYIKEEQQNG